MNNGIAHFCLVNVFVCSHLFLSSLPILCIKQLTYSGLGHVVEWVVCVVVRNFKLWLSDVGLVSACISWYYDIVNFAA